MQNIQAIILAAGKSTRFKTNKSKLLHTICGQELILYSIKLLEKLHIPATIVVGFQKEEIIETVRTHSQSPHTIVVQEEQLGTGHAVLCTKNSWQGDNILILNGDVPLLTEEIIRNLYERHQTSKAVISFIAAHNSDPSESYGRIVQQEGKLSIVEKSEFNGSYDEHCCINAGIYLIRRDFLEGYINALDKNNRKQEFYLTDLVKLASDHDLKIEMVMAPFDAVRGINTLKELWIAEHIKKSELIENWMMHGVRFNAPQTVHLDLDVSIGSGTVIGTGTQLKKGTQVGADCTIGEYCIIEHSSIADRATILPFTIINESTIEMCASVGPFAHIRNQSCIGKHATIGNFVEIKKSEIGAHTKAKHLSYLGDAHVGEHVNIGAGTITCNHNGVKKNTTVIQDGAYIGSNNSLIAPVTIGKNSFTGAGSTITQDVPQDALALGRAQQINKENYASKLREKFPQSSNEPQDSTILSFIAAMKSSDSYN